MNIESAARLTGKTVAEQTQHVDRCTKRAQSAIGQKLEVRLDRKTTVEGTIKAVKFSRYNYSGASSLKIVWEVTMSCGAKEVERTVHVSKLPRE